jgi:hypothetical protein
VLYGRTTRVLDAESLRRKETVILSAVVTLGICLGYALTRYVLLGPVPPDHIPAFVLNKAIAMASAIYLCRAAGSHYSGRDEDRQNWGRMAVHCGFLHGLITLAILSGSTYPALFAENRLSFRGETVILFGVLAAYGFWQISRYRSVVSSKRLLQVAASLVVSGHLFALGASGWAVPSDWNGGMPPISLISFVAAAAASLLFLAKGSEHHQHSKDTSSEVSHDTD